MKPEFKEAIRHLAGNALEYNVSTKEESIPDLNRQRGYCEAVMELILFATNEPTERPE